MCSLRTRHATDSHLRPYTIPVREASICGAQESDEVSDPTKLDISDWFAAIVTGIIAGIGGAMAWFNGSKRDLNARMGEIDDKLEKHEKLDADRHETQMIAMTTVQLNEQFTRKTLQSVQEQIKESAEQGAQEVSKMFEILLNEFRSTKYKP